MTEFDYYDELVKNYVGKKKYKNTLISLPLFRKEKGKIYVGYYVFVDTGIYADKPFLWLLIDINTKNIAKCYKCSEYNFDKDNVLPNEMKILLKPDEYLQLIYQDFTYLKMIYKKYGKYDFDKTFTKEYLEIDKLDLLFDNGIKIKYTDYFKNNISNYNSDEANRFVETMGKNISKEIIDTFHIILYKLINNQNYQKELTKYMHYVKFALIQDIQIITAFDNVSVQDDTKLNNSLETIANKIIPSRREEKMNNLLSKLL